MGLRRILPLLLIGFAALLSACAGLAGEPRIIATTPPQAASDSIADTITDTSTAQDDTAAVMTLGGEIWLANCVECHGQNGLGTSKGAPLPDLSNYTDDQILAAITNGIPDKMTAFGGKLAPNELTAAMTYAKMMSLAISRGMVSRADANSADSAAQADATQAAPAENAVLGVVTGQVTNGTAGAVVPADQVVTLHIVKSEFTEQTLDQAVSADGSFRFADVPFDSAYQYVVTAAYGDVMFVSQVAAANPAVPELALPVTLYEGGAPESAIQIGAISAQVMVQNATMQMIQIVSFANTSDRVYFNADGDKSTSVRLHLPQNATLLSSVSSGYILSDDGTQLYSTRPVMPGESQMMHVAYALPYGQSAAVDQLFDYPLAGRVDVVVATSGLSLTGDGFGDPQPVTLGSLPVSSYGGQMTRAAGSTLHFEVTGTPAVVQPVTTPTSAASAVSPIAYLLIGAGVAALLIAGLLALRDRTRPGSGRAAVGDLMEQIAALDAQHQSGSVSARDYERKRTALKAQLSALMKTQ